MVNLLYSTVYCTLFITSISIVTSCQHVLVLLFPHVRLFRQWYTRECARLSAVLRSSGSLGAGAKSETLSQSLLKSSSKHSDYLCSAYSKISLQAFVLYSHILILREWAIMWGYWGRKNRGSSSDTPKYDDSNIVENDINCITYQR